MKHNKKVIFALGILVVAIWGTIIYRIVETVSEGDSEEVIALQPGTSRSSKGSERYVYREDVRDPFQFRAETSTKPTGGKDTAARVVWTEPPFKLVGIMRKERATTAVLQRDDGATFFLRKGDTLAGLKILSVDDHSAEYTYRNQRRAWTLGRAVQ